MTSPAPARPFAPRGAWLSAALGVTAVVAVGRPMIGAGGGTPALALALAIFTAIMAIVLVTVGRHHPHPRFGAANHVTVARVVLTALLAGALLLPAEPRLAWWAIAMTVAAAALDGVDGRLARRSRLHSAFGARFDTEIDALLILVLSVLVWRHDKAGVWVVLCGLMRYLFLAAGWRLAWMGAPLSPTWRGKAVAVVQFFGLALALAPVVDRPVSDAVALTTLALLAWSFALDVGRLRRARA